MENNHTNNQPTSNTYNIVKHLENQQQSSLINTIKRCFRYTIDKIERVFHYIFTAGKSYQGETLAQRKISVMTNVAENMQGNCFFMLGDNIKTYRTNLTEMMEMDAEIKTYFLCASYDERPSSIRKKITAPSTKAPINSQNTAFIHSNMMDSDLSYHQFSLEEGDLLKMTDAMFCELLNDKNLAKLKGGSNKKRIAIETPPFINQNSTQNEDDGVKLNIDFYIAVKAWELYLKEEHAVDVEFVIFRKQETALENRSYNDNVYNKAHKLLANEAKKNIAKHIDEYKNFLLHNIHNGSIDGELQHNITLLRDNRPVFFQTDSAEKNEASLEFSCIGKMNTILQQRYNDMTAEDKHQLGKYFISDLKNTIKLPKATAHIQIENGAYAFFSTQTKFNFENHADNENPDYSYSGLHSDALFGIIAEASEDQPVLSNLLISEHNKPSIIRGKDTKTLEYNLTFHMQDKLEDFSLLDSNEKNLEPSLCVLLYLLALSKFLLPKDARNRPIITKQLIEKTQEYFDINIETATNIEVNINIVLPNSFKQELEKATDILSAINSKGS